MTPAASSPKECQACDGLAKRTAKAGFVDAWQDPPIFTELLTEHHALIAALRERVGRLEAEKGRFKERLDQAIMELELTHQHHGPKRRANCRGCTWLQSDFGQALLRGSAEEKGEGT